MCGCESTCTHTHTQGQLQSSPTGSLRGKRFCLLDKQLKREALAVSLLFTQSSWRFSSWFPLNEPPAGCLNRPLINPSVGSLLHPQPSEEQSNLAKHTERRLSAWRGGFKKKKKSGSDFCFTVL